MDKPTLSPPRHNPAALQVITGEGAELDAIIDWLERAFRAKPPDDLTIARIRRKLIQEWKARKLINMTAMLLVIGGLIMMMVFVVSHPLIKGKQ